MMLTILRNLRKLFSQESMIFKVDINLLYFSEFEETTMDVRENTDILYSIIHNTEKGKHGGRVLSSEQAVKSYLREYQRSIGS